MLNSARHYTYLTLLWNITQILIWTHPIIMIIEKHYYRYLDHGYNLSQLPLVSDTKTDVFRSHLVTEFSNFISYIYISVYLADKPLHLI